MPSEQPPTRVEEAARALDKVIWLTDDVPHEVLVPARELHEALLNEPDKPALAQPQPREGSYNEQADRVFSEQPRGEGDDLASRLDERAELWERKGGLGANIAAGAYRQAAEMARASTHPEQSARVEAMQKALLWYADPDHWLDGQAGEWIVEEGNHVSGDGFAHNEFEHDNGERALAALEPASPTPTEQENDR